jgi:hypothetical protein
MAVERGFEAPAGPDFHESKGVALRATGSKYNSHGPENAANPLRVAARIRVR